MRILVTGGTGLLGHWIVKMLSERGFNVIATYHRKNPRLNRMNVMWTKLDLEKPEEILEVVRRTKPEAIIHTAAYTDVDGCEANKEKAYKVNVLGTRGLAKLCLKLNLRFIYISTDYVFDGSKGMYFESDIPNPVNFYGLTKLLGEESVASACRNYVIAVSYTHLTLPTN